MDVLIGCGVGVLAFAAGVAIDAGLGRSDLQRVIHMRKLSPLIGAIGVLGSLLLVTFIAGPTPVMRFRTFYDSLTPGMTEEKVLSSLHYFFPQDGRHRTPQLRRWENGLHFILDPSDGRYNSEVITLAFHGKYTVAKAYLPD